MPKDKARGAMKAKRLRSTLLNWTALGLSQTSAHLPLRFDLVLGKYFFLPRLNTTLKGRSSPKALPPRLQPCVDVHIVCRIGMNLDSSTLFMILQRVWQGI